MSDAVDHPTHYNSHPSGIEAIAVCEHHNFNVGNAIKYLWRAGLKTASPVEDLRKAAWYVARELFRLTKQPGEVAVLKSENDALRRARDAYHAEVADYERTVAGLREKLRDEEARRASYQAVDAAARRFVAEVDRIEEATSRPIESELFEEIVKLVTVVRGA